MDAVRVRKAKNSLVQKLGLTSIAVGVLAALAKSWVTYWLGAPSDRPPVTPPVATITTADAAQPALPVVTTIEDLLEASPISLRQWQQATEADYANPVQRERAFRDFLGRQVVWEGYLHQYNQVQYDPTPEHAYTMIVYESRAELFSDRQLSPPSVRCWLPETAAGQLAQLKPGQWVVVRGTLSNPTLLGSLLCTDLDDCQILAARDVRKVDMVVAPQDSRTVIR